MISNHEGSLLLQLRNAALVEYDRTRREGMKRTADDLQAAIHAFGEHATGENLAVLNGLWARGCIWLENARGAAPEPPRRTIAVAA